VRLSACRQCASSQPHLLPHHTPTVPEVGICHVASALEPQAEAVVKGCCRYGMHHDTASAGHWCLLLLLPQSPAHSPDARLSHTPIHSVATLNELDCHKFLCFCVARQLHKAKAAMTEVCYFCVACSFPQWIRVAGLHASSTHFCCLRHTQQMDKCQAMCVALNWSLADTVEEANLLMHGSRICPGYDATTFATQSDVMQPVLQQTGHHHITAFKANTATQLNT